MIQNSLNIRTTNNINDLKYSITMVSILILENVKAEYNIRTLLSGVNSLDTTSYYEYILVCGRITL